jgi:protein-disulfide isomerase
VSRNLVSHATTGVLVLCAVLVTAAVVKREFFAAPAAASQTASTAPRPVDNWAEINAAGQVLGRADAPVRIVEFSDFQCPFCAQYQQTLRAVRARYPDQVAVVYRHFPLDGIHPHARAAAVATECAGEQGRFEAYHDALFARQGSIGARSWDRFAADAAVPDTQAFGRCVAEGRLMARVDRDADVAERTGITVTPSLVIDGTLLPGVVSQAELERRIVEALRK